jgi:DNA-binding HxlR family transcriptional regulator/putative sterol carrier protein
VPTRRYNQFCPLARTLDVAGDRWTLLIVRELTPGPRRFTDLLEGLPGISRKLLTDRLRQLESDGVIDRRELPPPAARRVYALTGDGRALSAAMVPLIAWGTARLGDRDAAAHFHPRWAAVAMAGLAERDAAQGVSEEYQFVVEDTPFYFAIDDGAVELHDGYAADPAVTWKTDEDTWAAIVGGEVSASSARSDGRLEISGDPAAGKRMRQIFSRHQPTRV